MLFSSLLLSSSTLGATPPLDFDFSQGGNAAGRPVYDPDRGFGYEASAPSRFSVRVPEGNYRVTLRFDGSRKRTHARVLAEQRRVMLEDVTVGKPVEHNIVVNVRTAELAPLPANATGSTRVALKPRELGSATWDDKLTLEIVGDATLRSLRIAPADLPTLYLAGDSTVTDQGVAPSASWGQMLPHYFAPDIAIANHAESGETLKSFVTELRLDKLLSTLRQGDWVMIQFGHNDQKVQWPQTYAEAATTYRSWLRTYIAEVRRRGATPLLVTSPERRNFDAQGRIVPSLGDYPDAVRAVAREEGVALIDLNPLSVRYYEKLGPDLAPRAFADEGRDKTHHSEYGAEALAGMVVEGLRAANPALTAGLDLHLLSDSPRD
ncbi:MAG TPA: rhamnogalacturonan acetylesterase [Steroidobacteraceae bacterium]|nr:rhamnogalacturonan acetylesterase [Steroidobacteraceae bacterium]